MKRRSPLAFLLFAGCTLAAACQGPNYQRVAADRATFDWFAPMFRNYVLADPRLDEAAKATHIRGLDAWDARIKADEAAAAPMLIPPAVQQ